jgi:enolase
MTMRYGINGLRAMEIRDSYCRPRLEVRAEVDRAKDQPKGWEVLTKRLGERVQLIGDDTLVSNPTLLSDVSAHCRGTASFIAMNRAGTVTETLASVGHGYWSNFAAMVSDRCGETPDVFIAYLAVETRYGQLRAAGPAWGERVAKYSCLPAIEATDADVAHGLRPDRPSGGRPSP